jgi:hypothetical protein
MEVDVISYSSCISACDKGAQWQSALLLLKLMPVRALQVDDDPWDDCCGWYVVVFFSLPSGNLT